MVAKVMFSSDSAEWATPQDLFDRYEAEYHFELDVAATDENAKCRRYFTAETDAFKQFWTGPIWMNPPYGRGEKVCKPTCKKKRCVKRGSHCLAEVYGIGEWVKKAATCGSLVCCLLPARTDTRWFQKWCLPVIRGERPGAYEFIPGRLKFGGAANGAPFPSLIVVFK